MGASVHNERIERLWRDVFVKSMEYFYSLFDHMVEHGVLQLDSPVHMCLHYVFVHRIDLYLAGWCSTWNNRKSTALGGMLPDAVWMDNLEENATQQHATTAIRNVVHVPTEAINAAKRDLAIQEDKGQFHQPRPANPLSRNDFRLLKRTINITRESDLRGMDVFQDVLEFVLRRQNARE